MTRPAPATLGRGGNRTATGPASAGRDPLGTVTRMLARIVSHPAAPAAVLDAAAAQPTLADSELAALLVHPHTPAPARDTALRRALRGDCDPFTDPFTGGADRVSGLAAHLHDLPSTFALLLVSAVTRTAPDLRADVDDLLLHSPRRSPDAYAWRYVFTSILTDTTRPTQVRDAATVLAAHSADAPFEAQEAAISLGLRDPVTARTMAEARTRDTLRAVLTAAGRPAGRSTPVSDLIHAAVTATDHFAAITALAHAGDRRPAVVWHVLATASTAPTAALSAIATYDAFSFDDRLTAARELLDPRRATTTRGAEAARVAVRPLVLDPRAPADVVIAHQRLGPWPWPDLFTLIGRPCLPEVLDAAVTHVLSTPRVWAAALELAVHPDVTHAQRTAVLRHIAAHTEPPAAAHGRAVVRAAAALPDRAAAGAALPCAPLRATTAGTRGALTAVVDAALSAALPTVSGPRQAAALVALAPTFTGTVAELFATATTVAG